jgi:hypothetical protein
MLYTARKNFRLSKALELSKVVLYPFQVGLLHLKVAISTFVINLARISLERC